MPTDSPEKSVQKSPLWRLAHKRQFFHHRTQSQDTYLFTKAQELDCRNKKKLVLLTSTSLKYPALTKTICSSMGWALSGKIKAWRMMVKGLSLFFCVRSWDLVRISQLLYSEKQIDIHHAMPPGGHLIYSPFHSFTSPLHTARVINKNPQCPATNCVGPREP